MAQAALVEYISGTNTIFKLWIIKKEDLFKLKRRGEVVNWAGAGLSLYAGYPKGSELAQAIYDDLSESAKQRINPVFPLTDVAEEYERIRGRNPIAVRLRLKQ